MTPRSRGSANRSAGFTLIEVLVALVIVAIALGAGIKAAGALADNADRLRSVSAAQWCADNQLTEMRLRAGEEDRLLPDLGESEFRCEQLGRSYRGLVAVRPTLNPNLRQVDAVVSEEGGSTRLTLTTIMARY